MADFWSNLKAMEQAAILSIITGAKPVEYFNEFVREWYAQGGELITAEANEMAGK